MQNITQGYYLQNITQQYYVYIICITLRTQLTMLFYCTIVIIMIHSLLLLFDYYYIVLLLLSLYNVISIIAIIISILLLLLSYFNVEITIRNTVLVSHWKRSAESIIWRTCIWNTKFNAEIHYKQELANYCVSLTNW